MAICDVIIAENQRVIFNRMIMSDLLLTTLLYALLPALAMFIGGIVATWRTPKPSLRSAVLHFAAGVVFSVVGVELLPDVLHRHAPIEAVVGFALGIGLMFGIKEWSHRLASKHSAGAAGLPLGLLVGIGIDVLIDGLLLGIGFAIGAKQGTLLALALAGEFVSLGLATATELGQSGMAKGRALTIVTGLALLVVAGGFIGGVVMPGLASNVMELVLSFGVAALLFLVTEELLNEAHEQAETPLLTSMFFVGFLAFMVLGMVG
jgi:ZIP family zinc transporter